MIFLVYEVVLY